MSSIGQVYYDVLPDLSKFGPAMHAGVASAGNKPVKIDVEADTRKATAGIKQVTTGNAGLTQSLSRLQNAQGSLRVAEARLAETRSKAAAGSARLLSAQESQARAVRAASAAQGNYDSALAKSTVRTSKLNEALNDDGVRRAGTGMMVAGAALLAGAALAVKGTADFEEAVSHVAATGEDAKASISSLRAEAIKYGADTTFSAKEAANAQAELIKANVSVEDTIKGGLKGALDLAAAGSLGVADAAGIMGTAMSQFQLPGTKAGHVADLLAAAAGKAQGEVGDFAEALKYVGPNANSAGVSIEETTGVLAMFANQGILGSQAGTSLRSMMVSLTAPVGAGAKVMQQYGINVRDARGEFIGLQGAAGELQKKLGDLGQAERDAALARIFGKNSLTAATIFYESGAEGVRKWTDAVADSGFAGRVAAEKLNNLKGDVEQLGGAIQSSVIGMATSSQTPLRGVVQGVTNVVDAFSGLSAATQGGIFKGAVVAGGALLLAGTLLKVATAANNAKTAVVGLGLSARTATAAAGAVGVVVTVAAAAFAHWAGQAAKAKQNTDDLTQALIASNGAYDANIAQMRAKALTDSGAISAAEKLGISTEDLTQASLGNVAAQERVNAVLATQSKGTRELARGLGEADGANNNMAEAADKVREAVSGGNAELDAAKAAYDQYAASVEAGTDAMGVETEAHKTQQLAVQDSITALRGMGTQVRLTAEESQQLAQSLFAEGNVAQASADAHLSYEAAIDGAAAAQKENGRNTKASTEAGRANLSALSALATAGKGYVQGLAQQGKGQKALVGATREVRSSFIDAAMAAGKTKSEARALADSYGLIPEEVSTTFDVVGLAIQQAKIETFRTAIQGLTKPQQAKLELIFKNDGAKAAEAYLNSLKDPINPPVTPKVDKGRAKQELDYFGQPIKTPVTPKVGKIEGERSLKGLGNPIKKDINVGTKGVPKAKSDVAGIKGKKVDVGVGSKGVPKTKSDIAGVRGKKVDVGVSSKGVPKTKSDIAGVRGKKVDVGVSSKGVPGTKADINSVRGKSVAIAAHATGIGSVQAAINSIRGKTVTIFQRLVKGKAAGGPVEVPGLASGGVIRGPGGPTDDAILGLDRSSRQAVVAVSNQEYITNAMQYRRNRVAVETINAGGEWDLVPRRKGGGPVVSRPVVERPREPRPVVTGGNGLARPIVINLRLDGEKSIRRIVVDELDAAGEYSASIDRMH